MPSGFCPYEDLDAFCSAKRSSGTEVLCISIPCPVNIDVSGLQLQLEMQSFRLTSKETLTTTQTQQVLDLISIVLGSLMSTLKGAEINDRNN